ncbi:hypothetical protein G5B35_06125 [Parapusillimonas sp. SGNA-6]|nr:hypothetical protein [Parapusillimonas sp. SGNA-6]
MAYRYPRASPSPKPVSSVNQVSHVLYQHDVMDTWCHVFGSLEEYDDIALHILALLARGRAIGAAVREVLGFWFDEPGLPRRNVKAVLRDIREVIVGIDTFKPFLFVNTEFAPDVDTIERLGLLKTEQYLALPDGFFDQSPSDQHVMAKAIIRQHWADAGGQLGQLGLILGYTLYRPNGLSFLYTRLGVPDIRANEIALVRRLTHPVDFEAIIARAGSRLAQSRR